MWEHWLDRWECEQEEKMTRKKPFPLNSPDPSGETVTSYPAAGDTDEDQLPNTTSLPGVPTAVVIPPPPGNPTTAIIPPSPGTKGFTP
jgi:hypothetical protein